MENNFYILNFNITSNAYVAENVTLSDMSVYDEYADGVSFKEKNIEIKLHKNRGEILHFIDNLYSLPIWSEKVINELKMLSENEVELYPVELEKDKTLNYFYVNILNLVDAIDFEKSDCVTMAPNIKIIEEVEELILFEEKIKELHIFRLKGLKLQIVISDKLKSALEKLNLSELEFIPIEDYKYDLNAFEW